MLFQRWRLNSTKRCTCGWRPKRTSLYPVSARRGRGQVARRSLKQLCQNWLFLKPGLLLPLFLLKRLLLVWIGLTMVIKAKVRPTRVFGMTSRLLWGKPITSLWLTSSRAFLQFLFTSWWIVIYTNSSTYSSFMFVSSIAYNVIMFGGDYPYYYWVPNQWGEGHHGQFQGWGAWS